MVYGIISNLDNLNTLPSPIHQQNFQSWLRKLRSTVSMVSNQCMVLKMLMDMVEHLQYGSLKRGML